MNPIYLNLLFDSLDCKIQTLKIMYAVCQLENSCNHFYVEYQLDSMT